MSHDRRSDWRQTSSESVEGTGFRDRDSPDPRLDDRRATTTRRSFLSVAALGAASATVGRVIGQTDDNDSRVFELDGDTTGWIGRRPSDIEGDTNPTLTLTPGETYEVVWENVDGAPHNFAIEDADGDVVVESENVSEEGETQTVEFTASEEMNEYVCQVHPNTMRGDVSIEEDTPTPTPTPEETAEETDEEQPQPSFQREMIEEHRGDIASFTLSLDGAEEATVILGSEAVNYVVSFTVVDGNGDDEVTVALDTFVAGQGEESGISTRAEEDEIRDYRRETPTISSPLDSAPYPIEVRIDDRPVARAVLVLDPRETGAANAGVAPRIVSPSDEEAIIDQFSRRSEVATGDWAGFEVEASGLYATFDGKAAFNDDSLGYELTIRQADVVNAEPEVVPLEDIEVIIDEENDRFFAVVDSSMLRLEETYEGTFTVTDANPYVPAGESEEVSTRFTVVEREATFDVDGDELSVPTSETILSGTTTVAPGTAVTVSVFRTGENPFQKTARTTVDDDGSWSASFDFSDREPGSTFSAQVLDLSGVVEGEFTSSE